MILTIGKRLIIIVLLSVIFMAAGIYISIITYNRLMLNTTLLLKETKKSELMLKDAQLALLSYRITHDEKYIRNFRNTMKSFKLDTEKRMLQTQKLKNKELIITVESSYQKLIEIEEKLEKLSKDKRYIETILVDLMYVLPGFSEDIKKFTDLEEKRLTQNTLVIKTTILILGVVITAMVIIFSLLISRKLVSGIKKLISVITVSTKNSDLTLNVNISSKDEIGQLAVSFNTLISTMLSIVKNIQANAEKVLLCSKRFSTLAGELSDSTRNITDTVSGVANGATQQFRQIEKTSDGIGLMLNSAGTVALKSQNALEKTDIASIVAKRGSAATKETINRMQQINEIVNNASSVIRKLGEKSEQISKIVDVITKIAEQTNILALNTAVEAARAGDSASGFAVVADEVRKLAEDSARSANEITGLIRDIQTETMRAVNIIESGTKVVNESKSVIYNTEKSLEEYLKALDEVMQLSQEISKITQEQTHSCDQIRKAVGAIEVVADENTRAAEVAFLSTKEQANLVKTIVDSTHELENISYELINTVKKFKI